MIIAVVGGGASGMLAAIIASKSSKHTVYLLERQSRVGKKLSATGNGRCNLTNLHAGPGLYHSQQPQFPAEILNAFDVPKTLAFFRDLGLLTTVEASGRVYPVSDQAASVVDVLRFALSRPNLQLYTGCEVLQVGRTPDGGFQLRHCQGTLTCDRLIIACGGLAGTKLGGSMRGYQLLQALGHRCTKLRPSLVQLRSSHPRCTALKGIRAQCSLQITRNGLVTAGASGEIQFTEYGLSGPAIFEVSRGVCWEPGDWVCRLNLLPGWSTQEIQPMLQKRVEQSPYLTCQDLLTGMVHNRLGRVVVQEAGLSLAAPLDTLSIQALRTVADRLQNFVFPLTEPMGMDCAQVTAGGVRTDEFFPDTLESRLCPGLYACGEVLDVDGDCGGYNLQWAWSSGYVAGSSAGRENA